MIKIDEEMQRKSVLFQKEQVKQAMSYMCSCLSEFSFQYQIFCVPFAQNIIKIVVKKEISNGCFHQGAKGTRKVKEPVVIVGSRSFHSRFYNHDMANK